MKHLVSGLLLAVATLVFPFMAAADNGPAEIDLKAKHSIEGKKAAVIFPHAKHQEKLGDCTKCHKEATGGALNVEIVNLTGNKNDFHQKLCQPCHVEMQVPKGKSCSTCHKKKK
jgi:cytochrome c553